MASTAAAFLVDKLVGEGASSLPLREPCVEDDGRALRVRNEDGAPEGGEADA